MFDVLRMHVKKRIDHTEEEFALCTTFFTPKKITKQQIHLQEGNICKAMAFVVQGCLRCYTIDEKGEEHVVQFAIEDWWISDLKSTVWVQRGGRTASWQSLFLWETRNFRESRPRTSANVHTGFSSEAVSSSERRSELPANT